MLREGRGKAICLQSISIAVTSIAIVYGKTAHKVVVQNTINTGLARVNWSFSGVFLRYKMVSADDIRNTSNQHLDGSM